MSPNSSADGPFAYYQALATQATQRGDWNRQIPRCHDLADWDTLLPSMQAAPTVPPLPGLISHEARCIFEWNAAPLPFRYSSAGGWLWLDRERYIKQLNRVLAAWLDTVESQEIALRRTGAYMDQRLIESQLTIHLAERLIETPLYAIADAFLSALCPIIGVAYGRVRFGNVTVEACAPDEAPYAEIDLYLPQEGA